MSVLVGLILFSPLMTCCGNSLLCAGNFILANRAVNNFVIRAVIRASSRDLVFFYMLGGCMCRQLAVLFAAVFADCLVLAGSSSTAMPGNFCFTNVANVVFVCVLMLTVYCNGLVFGKYKSVGCLRHYNYSEAGFTFCIGVR